MRLVEVEWEDAYNGNHDWFLAESVPDEVAPMTVRTVGWMVRETRERVTLAMSRTEHADQPEKLCDLFTIPSGCVVKIRKLVHG